jgi:hypothetical protein
MTDLFNTATKTPQTPTTNDTLVKVEKPYEAKAFLNFEVCIDVVVDGKKETLSYRPTGAKFTHKWVHENPELWKALNIVDNVHTKFIPDYQVVRGEELSRTEMAALMADLPDELKRLFEATQNMGKDEQYTNYVKVIGELFIQTKKGKVKLEGIFPPSFDFKAGLESKNLKKQLHLVAAVMKGTPIKFKPVSFEESAVKKNAVITVDDLI